VTGAGSVPGVGVIVALTVASAIDDPARFKSSKSVGARFGMTPKKYQSGETDVSGRISKIGDGSVRTAAYEAAHIILTKPLKGCAKLESWGMKLGRPRWRSHASSPSSCIGCSPTARPSNQPSSLSDLADHMTHRVRWRN
jgi:transposase